MERDIVFSSHNEEKKMNRQAWKIFFIALIILGIVGCGKSDVDSVSIGPETGIAQLLPSDTVLLLNVPNVNNNAFSVTQLGKLVQEPELQSIVAPFKEMFLQYLPMAESMFEQTTGKKFQELEKLLKGEIALSLVSLPGPTNPNPQAILAIGIEPVLGNELLQKLLGNFNQIPGVIEEKTIAKKKFFQFNPMKMRMFFPPVFLGISEETFFLTNSQELLEKMFNDKEAKLAKNTNFTELLKNTKGQSEVSFHIYLNLDTVWNSGLVPPQVLGIAKIIGIGDWKSLASSYGYQNTKFRQSIALYCPGEKRGLTKLLQGEPCSSKLSKFVPKDAISYTECGWDIAQGVQEILSLSKQFVPPDMFVMMDQSIKLTFLVNILKYQDKEFATFTRSPKHGSFFNDHIMLFSVLDQAKLQQSLVEFYSSWGFELKKISYKNSEIYYWQNKIGDGKRILNIERNPDLQLLGLLNPYRSYMLIDNQTIAYSNQVHSLKNYADFLAEKGNNLAETLAPILKKVGPHSSLSWSSKQAGNYAAGYRNTLGVLQSLEGVIRDLGFPLEIAKLPQAHIIEKYWMPGISVGESDSQKLAFTNYTTGIPDFAGADVPSLMSGGAMVFVIPVVAAIAVPGLLQARTKANEKSAIAALKSLATAQTMFQYSAAVDQDDDGTGEFGFIQELAGVVNLRGKSAPVDTSYISKELGFSASNNYGIAIKNGYCFLCYLPSSETSWINEAVPLITINSKHAINAQENKYIIYAWPQNYGSSGTRAFSVTESGEIYSCANYSKFSGNDNIPEAESILNSGNEYWQPMY